MVSDLGRFRTKDAPDLLGVGGESSSPKHLMTWGMLQSNLFAGGGGVSALRP